MRERKFSSAIFIITIVILSLMAFKPFEQNVFEIKILNADKDRGKIVVELYISESGWLKRPYRKIGLPANNLLSTASFQVPYGKYAVAVYHDLNNNGKLDSGFMGIPKEPIGFGNNHRPFGKPDYQSATIEFSATTKLQQITLFTVF
jgi:uncharacterized protein (DUF2141 family)